MTLIIPLFWFYSFILALLWGTQNLSSPGTELCLLQWKHGVLTTGPHGSPHTVLRVCENRSFLCFLYCLRNSFLLVSIGHFIITQLHWDLFIYLLIYMQVLFWNLLMFIVKVYYALGYSISQSYLLNNSFALHWFGILFYNSFNKHYFYSDNCSKISK